MQNKKLKIKDQKYRLKIKNGRGFSLVEVILAVAIFTIFASGAVVAVLSGIEANRLGGEETIASQYAAEGIEAARSIKNQGFGNLIDSGGTGIVRNGSNVWAFSGPENTFDKYRRVLTVESVDSSTKKVTSTVDWSVNAGRNNSVELVSYFTNWSAPLVKGGMLVYRDNSPAADAIKYRILDGSTGLWSVPAQTVDIDGSTNRVLRAAKLYSSSTRNEKILLSRHYDGTWQYIYGQVFDGSMWGHVQLLASWRTSTLLDVQNFDGDYLANGDFLAVYSNNSNIPQFAVWNFSTSTWTTGAMNTIGGVPTYIVAKTRPGTNELMAAFNNNGYDTRTEYFNNSSGYSTASWTAATSHAGNNPVYTKRFVDFAWNNNSIGALVFSDTRPTDRTLNVRTGVASGGAFNWGTINASAIQASNLGAVSIVARPNTANEFVACDKDANTTPRIICYEVTHATTPIFSASTIISAATDTGIQRSYHIAYKQSASTGYIGLGVFSDNSGVPKLKKFDVNTVWDSSSTPIVTTGYTPSTIKTVRLVPQEGADDVMALMTDASFDLYSVVWNGTTDSMYTTPAGKAFNRHGTAGSAAADFWYDFVWDRY